MNQWFESCIKYDKTGDDGIIKTVSEKYLLDAMSFTEAEKRVNEEIKPFISGDFLVSTIKRVRIAEFFESPDQRADKWFRSKVNFVVLSEDKLIEKRVPNTMYVKATDIQDALIVLGVGMKGTLSDYEIYSLSETPIMDVFKYVESSE